MPAAHTFVVNVNDLFTKIVPMLIVKQAAATSKVEATQGVFSHHSYKIEVEIDNKAWRDSPYIFGN